MFTGIVEVTGTVRSVHPREGARRLVVDAPTLASELAPGDSVAVDGACLTVVEPDDRGFGVDVIATTLERTVAGRYAPGHRVNLERAAKLGDRMDGHLVQGHVDGVGHLEEIREEGATWRMRFRIPADVARGTILHGSITLNGVSLTVSDLPGDTLVEIGVIPLTRERTNLGTLAAGDPVNVEGDLIGKYVGRWLALRPSNHPG